MKASVAAAAAPASAPQVSPGLFAPRWEKELHKALVASPNVNELLRVGADFEQARPLVALFEALWGAIPAANLARAIELLSWLFATGYDPAQDAFVQKYLPQSDFALAVAEGIEVRLPLGRDYIGLLLAELHQEGGDLPAAIDVVEQLMPSTLTALSLAELYIDQEQWADVVDLTENLSNEDETSTYLLIQRGIALREQGYPEASREALKEALRFRSRPAELRQRALVERGLTYLKEGKRAMARREFEKVLAENSTYPGLREHLELFEV